MSSGALLAGVLVAAIAFGAVALVFRLFWPKPVAVAEGDPWAQHNELRSPSLERAPEAADNAVDAAIAAQITGAD
jgi:hypothetical protein